MNLASIGRVVHERRTQLGLSQKRLAAMAGLSRVTINQLENGNLPDLGAVKLMTLLDLLGVELGTGIRKERGQALKSVSQTASVSYKTILDPSALSAALIAGKLPVDMVAHVSTLLDEAPLALVVAAVEEVAAQNHLAPKVLWKHVISWAHELHSPRAVWA